MTNLQRIEGRVCRQALVAVVVVLVVVSGCRTDRADAAGRDVVARAAGRQLTVDDAARLMASNQRVAVEPRAVGVLAELWVDYALLDSALHADSTLARVSLDRLVAPEREQTIIMKLRDRAIRADTVFSDAEVAGAAKERGIRLEAERADKESPRKGASRQPAEEEEREEGIRELRRALAATAQQRAEGVYLDSVIGASGVELTDRGMDLMRAVATRPAHALDSTTADQPIARYRGGTFTAGAFAQFLQHQPFELRNSLATASRDQLEAEVRRLVTTQLLLREAERQGIALNTAEEDAIRGRARASVDSSLVRVRELTRQAGVASGARRGLMPLVEDAIAGRGRLTPLGPLGIVVRGIYDSDIEPDNFAHVVARVHALRTAGAPALGASDSGVEVK